MLCFLVESLHLSLLSSVSSFLVRFVQLQRFLSIRPCVHLLFLFTQVVVVVNEITGSCSGNNCTFEYSADQTPTLTSISPDSGPGGPDGTGTEITLGGTGFSSNNDDNIVTIGGSTCVIISSSTGSITCRAGRYPFGYLLLSTLSLYLSTC